MLLLVLSACGLLGPGLDGDWEGEVDCRTDAGDVSSELELELDADGGGSFSGELAMVQSRAWTYQGSPVDLVLLVDCEAELETTAASGEQELDYDIEIDQVECEVYQADSLVAWGCADIGFGVDTDQSDFGVFTWDGADTIEIDDGSCQGELER